MRVCCILFFPSRKREMQKHRFYYLHMPHMELSDQRYIVIAKEINGRGYGKRCLMALSDDVKNMTFKRRHQFDVICFCLKLIKSVYTNGNNFVEN